MAWFTPFLIAAAMNAPSLLRSGNVGNFARNTALGGATGNLLGNLVPSDIMPTQVGGQVATQASQNLPLAMLGPESINQGILSTAGNAASVGGANLTSAAPLDTAKTFMPSYMDTTGQTFDQSFGYVPGPGGMDQFPSARGFNELPLMARTDVPQIDNFNVGPDMGAVVKSTPQEIASQTGGFAEKPLYERAYEKVANYVEENPIEAGMLGLTVAGGIYDTLYPEGEKPQFIPGQVRQPTKVELGQPLRIRRPFGRG